MRRSRNADGARTQRQLAELDEALSSALHSDPDFGALCDIGSKWRDSFAAAVHREDIATAFRWLETPGSPPSPRLVIAAWDEWMEAAHSVLPAR